MQPMPAPAAPEDGDILEPLRAGEHGLAFERLLQRYDRKVYRLCCAILRDPTQAQDAAQESLVRIWKALPRYDGRASLSTWIYAIARNRCLTALERRRELASLSDAQVEAEWEAGAGAVAGEPDGEAAEQGALLRELVERLPERYRRVVTLYYYEDRALGEVARMLNQPEGTIKTHLYRARAALLEQLQRSGMDRPELWFGSSP